MADDSTEGNDGAEDEAATETGAAGTLQITHQYIKDLSFENPRAPAMLIEGEGIPNIEMSLNVSAEGRTETSYEVVMEIRVRSILDGEPVFLLELDYAGHVLAEGVEEEARNAFLMMEVPLLLFPFVREILASVTHNGGYPPLLIQPLDFYEMYSRNMAKQQEAAAGQA